MIQNTKQPLVALAIAGAGMLGAVSIPVGKTVHGQGKAPTQVFEKRENHRIIASSVSSEVRRSEGD